MNTIKVLLTWLVYAIVSGQGQAFSLISSSSRTKVMTPTTKVVATLLGATNRPAGKATNKRKEDIDLSYIESRDMTREEMFELNKVNESNMNKELVGMTGVSLLFSLPILYLVWVAYFSE